MYNLCGLHKLQCFFIEYEFKKKIFSLYDKTHNGHIMIGKQE